MNKEVLFNSRESFYKEPFGAVDTHRKVSFRFSVCSSYHARGVALLLHRGEHRLVYEMSLCAQKDGYDTFTCSFVSEREGNYFYRFSVHGAFGEILCGKGKNGDAFIGEKYPEWQLSVYKSNYETPHCFRGGTVYHIFCDRFCSVGDVPAPRYGKLLPWGQIPGEPDGDGIYRADDFFGGNFAGIRSKLDYLQSLGITALYLSPIFKSNSNHRYDTADYSQVDEMLGGNKGFEALLADCKNRGIDIILDGVFNHTGADSVYFNKFGHFPGAGAFQSKDSPYYPWYTFIDFPDSYHCWWGIDCVPTVARDAVGYQTMIEKDVVGGWIQKGVRGWRLDVVDELSDAFVDGIRNAVKENDKDCVLIGEVWEDASNKWSYGEERRYFQGDQLDGVMNYVFKDAILDYLSVGDGEEFADTVLTLEEHYPERSLDCCLTLLDSHDTFRALTALSETVPPPEKQQRRFYRLTEQEYALGKERLLLASCLQYFLPGVPSLYYGDEIGMYGFEDPFNRCPFTWDDIDEEILAHYRRLGSLRRKYRNSFIGFPKITAHGSTVTIDRGEVVLTVDADRCTFVITEK